MSFWSDFFAGIGKMDETMKKFMENPLIDHGIDWLGDFLMLHPFRKNAAGIREVDPQWLRKEAPRLYARTSLDENLLREITYRREFKYRVALFDNWGPDEAVTDPDPLLGQIGPHQWDDFRLNLVDALFSQTGPAMIPLQDASREAKILELCVFLTEIAQLSDYYKLRRLVQIRYCRSRETDYKVVKFQQLRKRVFKTAGDLLTEIGNWISDPGPTEFVTLSTNAAAGIDTAGVEVRNWLENTATPQVNNLADRIRPRGLLRWLAGR